jgi:hypothetical protein
MGGYSDAPLGHPPCPHRRHRRRLHLGKQDGDIKQSSGSAVGAVAVVGVGPGPLRVPDQELGARARRLRPWCFRARQVCNLALVVTMSPNSE